jgi:hypothetical protein
MELLYQDLILPVVKWIGFFIKDKIKILAIKEKPDSKVSGFFIVLWNDGN